jgi:hypothetical protein
MRTALDRARYETCILQHPHMFRCAGEAHVEGVSEFPDREFPFRQTTKHGPPRRIRESMKDNVEMGGMFNHVV